MPWTLEIHHIGLLTNGDATLIIARQVPPAPPPAVNVRSLLIDGGRKWSGPLVSNYIGLQLGGKPIDAIICTHYDPDHMNGLSYLLRQPGRCTNTVIYDQGWEGGAVVDPKYIRYLYAINGLYAADHPIGGLKPLSRTRVTWTVQSDFNNPPLALPADMAAPAVPPNLAAVNLRPDWLLTGAAPQDPLWYDPVNNPGAAPPAGAPTVRFIAANGYVRRPPGFPGGPIGGPFLGQGQGGDPRNEKSLAVEVTFGNFRYYAGGDLENGQEVQLLPLLNNGNDVAGRVLAMKASNHGANTSTSQPFVDRIRPAVAFVSCGNANMYGHPARETLNVLDGYPPLAAAHAPAPPPAPNLPVRFYLTGFAAFANPPLTYGGDMSQTSGDPIAVPAVPGDVVLTVDAEQSAAPVHGKLYRAVEAATLTALTAPGLGGALGAGAAGPIALTVAGEAFDHGPGPAAASVINQVGGPVAAAMNASAAANGLIPPGNRAIMMAQMVTAAAMANGAAPAAAAGAGAAAGTYYGGGTGRAAWDATRNALRTAGIAADAASAIAQQMVVPPAPDQFQVRFYSRLNVPHWVTNPFS